MDGEDFGRGGEPGSATINLEIGGRGRVEVIGGVERRRRWSRAEKAQITGESFMPGASVSDVARRHGVSLGLLHHWRRATRQRSGDIAQSFVPIVPAEESSHAAAEPRISGGVIEIELCGASIRLHGPVDGSMLRTVLAAVRRA